MEFWWLCFNRLYLLKALIVLCLLSSACIATRWTFPGPQMVGAFYNTDCIWPEGEKCMRSLLISLQGCVFLILVSPFSCILEPFLFLCFHCSKLSSTVGALLAVQSRNLSPQGRCLLLNFESGLWESSWLLEEDTALGIREA